MKISYNTWAYSSFFVWVPAYTLDETIKRLARTRLRRHRDRRRRAARVPGDLGADRRRRFKELLDEHGLALSSMLPAPSGGPGTTPLARTSRSAARRVEHYKELAELTAAVGRQDAHLPARLDRSSAPPAGRRGQWSREVLTEVADAIAHTGVTLVIEPTSHDTNLCDSADDAIELMEDVDRPNVKLMFDTFHVMYQQRGA